LPRAPTHLLGREEGIEDAAGDGLGDASSGVGDGDDDVIVLATRADADRTARA
jgi:hypothetical protein